MGRWKYDKPLHRDHATADNFTRIYALYPVQSAVVADQVLINQPPQQLQTTTAIATDE